MSISITEAETYAGLRTMTRITSRSPSRSRPLEGRVVVITGASAGVGRATARKLAQEGADVALIARGAAALDATAREVKEFGARALPIQADVANAEQVEDAAATVESELGPIDIWLNNAMTSVFMPFHEIAAEDFKRVTEVTYLGYVYGTMAALSRMRARRRGHIIQVGSALAYRGIPLQSAYCGAKHAIQGFTESLRCELLSDAVPIDISIVHLPALNTPQFHWVKTNFDKHPQPVPPIFQPEVAADAVFSVIQKPRAELLVGASTAVTVWSNKLVPRVLDHYLARHGVASQQAPWPIEDGRPNNLYDPVDSDQGAHGEFDADAKSTSYQLWLKKRSRLVSAAMAVGVMLVAVAVSRENK